VRPGMVVGLAAVVVLAAVGGVALLRRTSPPSPAPSLEPASIVPPTPPATAAPAAATPGGALGIAPAPRGEGGEARGADGGHDTPATRRPPSRYRRDPPPPRCAIPPLRSHRPGAPPSARRPWSGSPSSSAAWTPKTISRRAGSSGGRLAPGRGHEKASPAQR